MFELSDVSVDGDGAAIRHPALTDADPGVVVLIFGESLGIRVLLHAFGDPTLGCLAAKINQLAIDDGAQDSAKRNPGNDQIGNTRIEIAEFAVAHYETIVRIVEDEAIRNRLEGRLDQATLTIAFVGQSGPFHNALAKQLQRLRHRADFIA